MTVRLTLISQGATAANRASAFSLDEPLETPALSVLRSVPPISWRGKRALASPMQAARQTADALALDCGEDLELRDVDYGIWKGRAIAKIGQREADTLASWLSDPEFSGHGGESLAMLFRRTSRWLDNCAGRSAHTVAVTHAAVIRAMIVAVLGATPDVFWRIDIAPATATELSHDGRRWAMRSCGSPLAHGLRSD